MTYPVAAVEIENWDVLGVWVTQGDHLLKPMAPSDLFSTVLRTS